MPLVTTRLLIQRLNYQLSKAQEQLRPMRTPGEKAVYGDYVIMDLASGLPDTTHVDILELGRWYGVLREDEVLDTRQAELPL